MKTVKEWLNELPEEIRERAISNAEASGWVNAGCMRAGDAIGCAFHWKGSPEGELFWNEWSDWLYDPTQPKPTIKPADEVESDHIPAVREMVEERKNETLSRRDQFAMAAMQGICSHPDTWGKDSFEKIARAAVEAADALIQELDKTEKA
jgi:hypothetical protein